MIHETNLTNVEKDDLIFHFVPEIGENNDTLGDDVKEYVNQFLTKLCVEYETKPNTIGLVGDIPTLTKVVGRLVQDYEKYKGLNEELTLI